jgi:molybdate transport system substrate-binding protein
MKTKHDRHARPLPSPSLQAGKGAHGACRGGFTEFVYGALLCISVLLTAGVAHARDLVVYGEPTLEKALNAVGRLWQTRSGTRVNVFVARSVLSYAQIDRGARCDVIFALAGEVTDEAARRKTIDAGSVRRALRNALVLVGSEPVTVSQADTRLAEIGRLIAGNKIAIADPDRDPGGAQALALLRKLGIDAGYASRDLAVAESSADVVSLLSAGAARLGIVYATDAAGFRLRVPLPSAEYVPIEYVVAKARDPQSNVGPFMTFIQSAEAKTAFRTAGLRTVGD